MSIQLIKPDWPAPSSVKAYTTTRQGGTSLPPFDSFNLAAHVKDNVQHLLQNRYLLKQHLQLKEEPIWLTQTHSTVALAALPQNQQKEGDASYTDIPHRICVVMTADCLPLLLCNRTGTKVAAVHAGWRGLLNGVIESTLIALNLPSEEILVWLGPAIGPCHFEVGEEVREAFLKKDPAMEKAFSPSPEGRWLANLYYLAKERLQKQGIKSVYGGCYCTYCDSVSFYSYRRDGEKTGRMASLIWLTA